MQRKLVAFTGAQGVGKSTLIHATADHLRGLGQAVTIHEGIGNEAKMSGVPLGKLADVSTIAEFARLHCMREHGLANTPGFHLFDRCFVDLLAYAELQISKERFVVELIRELMRISLSRMDLLIMIPIISKLSVCKSVNETGELRVQHQQLIRDILSKTAVRYIELTAETIEGRVNEVCSALSAC